MKLLNTLRHGGLLLGGFAILTYPTTYGQEDEQIYEMSPFTVDASQDEGYRATNTLAGTRISTNLKDLGTSIQVITEDFLEDIAAVDANELLIYTTNTEIAGIGGNFSGADGGATLSTSDSRAEPQSASRVRGLFKADLTRGYFKTLIPFDSYNTSTIDINRGSNATLFGLGSPAGIVNNSPNEAYYRNTGKFVARFDDDGSIRGSLDLNRILIEDKLAIRLSLLKDDREFQQQPAFDDSERLYSSIKWNPRKSTTIKANYENGSSHARRPDTLSPRENLSSWFAAGKPILDQRLATGILFDAPTSQGGLGGHSGIWVDTNKDGVVDLEARPEHLKASLVTSYLQRADGSFYNEGKWTLNTAGANKGFVTGPNIPFGKGSSNNLSIRTPRLFAATTTVVSDFNATGPDQPGFQGTINADYTVPGDALTLLGDGQDETRLFTSIFGADDYYDNYNRQGFVDNSVYDFKNNLIGGSTSFQNTDFDAFNISFGQTFLENKIGFEVAYDRQNYFNHSYDPLNSNFADIWVDVNTLLPDGRSNPNFGRPFMIANGNNGGKDQFLETKRVTAFVKHDFAEQFDSGLGKWLGNHSFTALIDRSEESELRFSQRLGWNDPDLLRTMGVPGDSTHNVSRVAPMVYIGPSLLDVTSLSDVRLDGAGRDLNLWTPGALSTVTFWDSGAKTDTTNFSDRTGDTATIKANGKFITREVEMITGVSSASIRFSETKSEAAVLQSHFFGGSFVSTVGYRKDSVVDGRIDPDPLNTIANPGRSLILSELESTGIYSIPTSGSADRWTYQGVYHVPQKLLPDSVQLSLHYAESSNFQLDTSRVDWQGGALPFPSGNTEEMGISIGLFNNKLHARLNKYTTALQNSTAGHEGRPVFNDILQSGEGLYASLNTHTNPDFRKFNLNFANARLASLTDGQRALYSVNVPIGTDGIPTGVNRENPSPAPADLEDLVAEGYELELTFNPTKNWRFHANIAQQETVKSNLLARTENEYLPKVQSALDQPIPGFEHLKIPVDFSNPTGATRQLVVGDIPRGGIDEASFFMSSTGLFGGGTEAAPTYGFGTVQTRLNDNLTSFRTSKALEGARQPEQREWRFNLVTNYSFREGKLKGLSLGGGYRWQDEIAIGFPLILNQDGLPVGDVMNPIFLDPESSLDLSAGYAMPFFANHGKWKLQLNVRNVGADGDDVIPVQVQAGQADVFARVRTAPQTQYVLTSTFTF